ncbi:MAG: PIG-L family deacetylase [Candidatus Omnitrophica bacterium]|nr:PIG-L family deacetylase [Candidatus Omnitrophota bacterium]
MSKTLAFLLIFCGLLLASACGPTLAGVITPLPAFTDTDRVLVLAPHPDDEGIVNGGIIQQALKAGARVKVVLLTNGENNELSFIVYKKRPVLRPKELLAMGAMRFGETLNAVKVLGLSPEDITVLGYPDFGTMDIFTEYWGPVKKPFRSMLSRQRYVPFKEARSVGAPYVGESILRDLEGIVLDFKPTRIFVSHPADTNRDHRALYLFTKVALWDLEGQVDMPLVFPYIVHVVGWPKPRGYHPELVLDVPPGLVKSDIQWFTTPLEGTEIKRKHDAIMQYVSQVKCAPQYLITFDRSNEIFGDYPSVPIIKQMTSVPAWQRVGAGDEGRSTKVKGKPDQIASISYARQGNNLLVRMILKNSFDKELGVSLFLMGYRKDVPFGQMPKLKLIVGIDGFHIKNGKKNIASKEVQYISKDRELMFTIPLSLCGSPERILSTAKTSLYDLTLDETAWRILLLK